jgi:uncharacterized delta-60 repeat protein
VPTNWYYFALTRLNSNGLFDSLFGNDNTALVSSENQSPYFEGISTTVIELTDGKILEGGSGLTRTYSEGGYSTQFQSLYAVRYKSVGSSDSSFGSFGLASIDFGAEKMIQNVKMAVQPDGKILLAGTLLPFGSPANSNDLVLARLNSNGVIDSTFGVNGITITDIDKSQDQLSSVLFLENNKILITANFVHGQYVLPTLDSIAVLRYNIDGKIDSGFGKKGKIILSYGNKPGSNSTSSLSLPSGKIIIGGYSYSDSSFLLAAINKNGTLDSSFGNNGFTLTSFKTENGVNTSYDEQAFAYDMALAPDGKIVVTGSYKYKRYETPFEDMALARYYGETVLQITLSSFTATKKQNSLLLNWQTANETNNSYFSLERSNNNNDGFKEIARVNSKGNSSQTQQYSYEDLTPLNGNNYYRLKQFDKNGNTTTSKIVLVEFSNNKIKIFPNPASAILSIEGLKQGTKANLSIVNSNGVIVAKASTDNYNYVFNIRSLPAGTYFVKIKNEDIEVVKQFIKR